MSIKRIKIFFYLIFLFLGIILIYALYENLKISYFDAIENNKFPLSDERNLSLSWRINLNDNLIYSPVVTEKNLIIQTENYVKAFDKTTKKEIWSNKIHASRVNCPPISDEYYTLVSNEQNEVLLLNNLTGSILWESKINANKNGNGEYVLDFAIGENYIFVARFSDATYILDKNTGNVLNFIVAPDRDILTIIPVEGNVILISQNRMRLVNIRDGHDIWSRNGEFDRSSGIIQNTALYLIMSQNNQKYLSTWDIPSGTMLNHIALEIENPFCFIMDEKSALISGDGLEKINFEINQKEWSNYEINKLTCPLIMGEVIFVRNKNGTLFKIDQNYGNLISKYAVPSARNIFGKNAFVPKNINDELLLPISENSFGGYK